MAYLLSAQYIRHIKTAHRKPILITSAILIALGYSYALTSDHRVLFVPILVCALILIYQCYKLYKWHTYAHSNSLKIDPTVYTLTHTQNGKSRAYLLVDINTISVYKTNQSIHKLIVLFNDNTRLDLSHYTPLDLIARELKADLKWNKQRKYTEQRFGYDNEIKFLPHS